MDVKSPTIYFFVPFDEKRVLIRTLSKRMYEGVFLYKKRLFLTRYAKVPYFTQHEHNMKFHELS